jgi:multidrug efflux pump subunit AcrB
MPNITDFAVRRPQFTLIAFLMMIAFGVISMMGIPKAEDPTMPGSNFSIVAVYPGAAPDDIERLVVDPIEERVKRMDGIKKVQAMIDGDVAIVIAEFKVEVDADKKRDELERELGTLRPTLPKELYKLESLQLDPSQVSVMQLALLSETATYRDIESEVRQIEKRLENVAGVGDVKVRGLPPQEVHVALDVDRLVALRVSATDVLRSLTEEGALVPGGVVQAGAKEFSVKTSGDFKSTEDVRNTMVRVGQGQVVKLSDIAKVVWRDGETASYARMDGKRAVFVSVPFKKNQNVFEVRAAVETALTELRSGLPAAMTLDVGFDQTENVEHRLSGFGRDFVLAILLVLITLLPLGLRAGGIVMVSIPLSLAMGVTLLKLLGFSINQLSVVGFVIALGLLVDDSIVVIENIARVMREGKAPKVAAVFATNQILASVLGCTATLIFAFLPLLFLPEGAGQFIRSLPVAVVVTVFASLLVSITIVPFLASRFLKAESHEGNRIFQIMTKVIEASYRPILEAALKRPKSALVIAFVICGACFALVPKIGFSLFPKANARQFLITVEAPKGASLQETEAAVAYVERTLKSTVAERKTKATPTWLHVMTSVGRGNPQIYYNLAAKEEISAYGEVFVNGSHYDPTESPRVYEALRAAFQAYPGARIELKEFENGPPLDAPIAMRVLGTDPVRLGQAAALVEATLAKTPGTTLVQNPDKDRKTDLRVRIDREKAGQFGVDPIDIDRSVRLALAGVEVSRMRPQERDDSVPVRVVLGRPGDNLAGSTPRATPELLRAVMVPTKSGQPVRIGQVADIELEPSKASMRHFNRERAVLITSQVLPGMNTDKVTQAALKELTQLKLPEGTRLVPAGEIESRKESLGGLGAAIAIALFGILAVLVLEFRNFRGTLIVASVIPLGIAGGMVALLLTGNTLSFTANIGFVALMGIEVKNSILLVDFTNQLRREGLSIEEAVRRAGEIRFVPILLTTLTAIGGLIPLALEKAPLYSPLAWVLIGGLVSSTLLARIVTPILYVLLAPPVGDEGEQDVLDPQLEHGGAACQRGSHSLICAYCMSKKGGGWEETSQLHSP